MQKGRVYQHGNQRMFRYKVAEIVNGQRVWRNRYEKLAPVEKYTSARSAEEGEHERLVSLRKSTDTSKLTASHIQLVTDFVENVYFPAKKTVLKPSTITGYRDFYNRNLKPEFGLMRMTDVNLGAAQDALRRKAS